MQVWDGISSARITFSSPSPEPDLFSPLPAAVYAAQINSMATLVENLNLQRGALRYLESKKVEMVDGRRVAGIQRDETGWPIVKLEAAAGEESRSLRARLLVRRAFPPSSWHMLTLRIHHRSELTEPTVPLRATPRSTRSDGPTTSMASLPAWRSPPRRGE